jgi:hypothetical protein
MQEPALKHIFSKNLPLQQPVTILALGRGRRGPAMHGLFFAPSIVPPALPTPLTPLQRAAAEMGIQTSQAEMAEMEQILDDMREHFNP